MTETAPPPGALVHLVDDDDAIRDALAWLFASRGLTTQGWADGESFLAATLTEPYACVVLDFRLGGMTGLEVFERMNRAGRRLPVIFLTAHGDVPVAVEALKKGAFDFVEKPFNDNALVDVVLAALRQASLVRRVENERGQIEARLATLTPRELAVMEYLIRGALNKQIAGALTVSVRTVEVHRSRIFEKMGVRNAVELARVMEGLRGG